MREPAAVERALAFILAALAVALLPCQLRTGVIDRVPVIGIGGIYTAEDVLEFMMAGASAVQIGTVNFNDPLAGKNVLEDLSALCRRESIVDINEIKGIC